MGFLAGFSGGVTLTLGITYLALLTHRRNREQQAGMLQSQTFALDMVTPTSTNLPARRSTYTPEGVYVPRQTLADTTSTFVEAAKARWNAEIINAVRWVQGTDWNAAEQKVEDNVVRIARESRIKERTVEAARETNSRFWHAEERAVEKIWEAEKKAAQGLQKAEQKAVEVTHQVGDAMAKGVERGKEMVGKAKAAVYLAEEKLEAKVDAKLMGVSEIEKALNQRFDPEYRRERMSRTVEETLAERYIPIEKRDNSILRFL
ncbi:hypothetical protein QBC35DRAFT_489250 [Podospora australis]|uniref:MICOS complex subunit MIC12 n=1 Tax=Podospora australis TaxID=1536484 RepID=A0AAN7ALM6_9PEZI|nr:hypothetical protein QBC35DRAFT_489250 [Podospora australis]